MFFFKTFALNLVLLSSYVSGFPGRQVQPGCYPPPKLASNFTTNPSYWRSVPLRLHSRQSVKVWPGWQNIRYLFSFGDSYTSTGFTISGEQPNPSNPLGNPAYPGLTSSNGPNYIDFLATTYNESYIQTFNLGYGGATIDPNLVPSAFGDSVQSFQQQVVQEFSPDYVKDVNVPWSGTDSLFTIFFGINDVLLSYAQQNSSLNYDIIKSYERFVHQLYGLGARNFVFLNVPPIDRTPGSLAQSASVRASIASYIGEFNFRLGALVYNLGTHYPDITSFSLDANFLFTRVLDNPASFQETSGYLNTTSFCVAYRQGTPTMNYFDPSCGIPVNEYLWLNDLHPTYPIHNLIASQIVQELGA